MKAVILAGGLGTRLGEVTKDIPKPMVNVAGLPVLEHQIMLLKEFGITNIIIVVSHLSSVITEYFADGKKWGVHISYSPSTKDSGTAGAILPLRSKLHSSFLLLYGDTMLSMDLSRFLSFHRRKKGSLATLLVHPNDHPFDSDLVETDETDQVIALHSKPHAAHFTYHNLVNAGVYILSPKIFRHIEEGDDFGKNVFPRLVQASAPLYAYSSPEYCKDMGTPKRLTQVNQDAKAGKIMARRLDRPQRAVFLDRDGVLIKQVDQLHRLEHVDVYPFTAEAIRKINEAGYLAIIITNQPMVARGLLTLSGLQDIHKHIETSLGEQNAKIDAIYFCPHHPHKGYEGEVATLKIECTCRKPKPGLIFDAVKRFHIDLSQSYFIGDSTSDILTAKNANTRSVLVKTGFGGKDKKYDVAPDYIFPDLLSAVESLL